MEKPIQVPTDNPYLIILGVFIGLFVIGGALRYVNKMFNAPMQDWLTRVIVLVLVALTCLWIVDKLVFVNRNLLTPEQSDQLFDLMKGLILLIFGVYFGTKKSQE